MNSGPDQSYREKERPDEGSGLEVTSALEDALRRALRPEEPPPGFTGRVLARAGIASTVQSPANVPGATAAPRGKLVSWPARRLWVGGAVAAALILGTFEGGAAWRRVREQQRRAADATAQFEASERVTVRALAQAREQLQRAGVPLTMD